MFVWVRVLCGTRKHQSASVDCSGVILKIHMRKIDRGQGLVHDEKCGRFHDLGTFDKAPGTLQSSRVRADAQCCKITWLEELASESNTIQAQEDISMSGKTAGKYQVKLYMGL